MKYRKLPNIWLVVVAILISLTTSLSKVSAQTVTLIKQYPSDASAFTQGLELNDEGDLFISTGLYGKSLLGEVDLNTGEITVLDTLDEQYFGEGMTFTKDALWQFTWREHVAFKRDKDTFERLETVNYEEEGWGLAYDEDRDTLWHSDGSSTLYQRDPNTFEKIKELTVTVQGKPIEKINELEYAMGAIYANIWYSTTIVKIDPETGQVVESYDLAPLLKETMSQVELDNIDTLNGIAHISGDRFYITGKLFPYIYEVTLTH